MAARASGSHSKPSPFADGLQSCLHVARREAAEVEALAAGDDGGQDPVRFRGAEDEVGPRRGLLQRLEERVEGEVREHVDLVDDVHLGAALRRPGAEDTLLQVADVVDAPVAGGVHLDEVQSTALVHVEAEGAGVVGVAVMGLAEGGVEAPAVEGLGKDAGGRRLAGAARPAEEVGVGDATLFDGLAQRLHHGILAGNVRKALRTPLPVEDLLRHGAPTLPYRRRRGPGRRPAARTSPAPRPARHGRSRAGAGRRARRGSPPPGRRGDGPAAPAAWPAGRR